MTLRGWKRLLRQGHWILKPEGGPLPAKSEFQKGRREVACTAARVYLEGDSVKTEDIGRTFRVTPERGAQLVRLGVKLLIESQTLQQIEPAPSGTRRSKLQPGSGPAHG